MNDTKRKLLKLVLVCLICIGLATGLALFIQSLTR
jgi:cytochrome c-type biogenesis protein CcmE